MEASERSSRSAKIKYGLIFGFVGVVLIVIIVLAIVLKPVSATVPVPAPTPTHHFPIVISPINVTQSFELSVQLGGVTPVSCVIYVSGTLVGIVLSANHVIDDFYTIETSTGAQAISKSFPVSLGYSAYSSNSGAVYDTSAQFVTTFVLDIHTTTVNAKTQLTNIPSNKFNPEKFVVSDIGTQVIVASLVLAASSQVYDLIAFEAHGALLPNLTVPGGLPVNSDYPLLLASSNQSFLNILVFDSTQSLFYDVYYSSNTTIVQTVDFSGSFVGAALTQNAQVLILVTTNIMYYYTRASSGFLQQDFLVFPFALKSCAVDSSGTYFAMGSSETSIVLGKLETLVSNLRVINNPAFLTNANGPCGIQRNGTSLFIVQADTSQHAVLVVVPEF